MQPESTGILLTFVILVAAGCGGPHVKESTQGTYHPIRYRKVVILPFQVRGGLTAEDEEILRGWVERDLLVKKYNVRPWSDVDLRVRDHPRKGELTPEALLYEACSELGIKGIWNARVEMSTDEDGQQDLDIVLRLMDPSTGLWVMELRGEDTRETGGRLAWRDLLEQMLVEVPPLETPSK